MSAMSHHLVVQEFLNWHKTAQVTEPTHDNGLEIKRSFISNPLLQSYFDSPRKVQTILKALFSSHEHPPIDPSVVWKSYLKIFCILLLANKGKYIQLFTPHHTLSDQYLPFESCPTHFPIASADNCRFFELFYEQQWQFCAPQLVYDTGKRFAAKDWVLPITQKVKLGDGASASIFKITIDPAYNELRDPPDSNDPDVNTFVLKTYKTKDAEKYCRAEVDAFTKIQSGNRHHHQCIIGFYGSFVRDGTYNILLEYANKGTLEQYFQTTAPPQSGKDILKFWRELFAVIQALYIFHNARPSDYDGEHNFLGWHQDVKPNNILVSSTHPESPYDCNFKLADLANSHSRRIRGDQHGVTDKDTYGTRAYGAPECYRSNGSIGKGPRQITQKVDIWSVGCVLSEAAMWVSRGRPGLLEYRRRRKQETDGIHDFQDGDCFHDGEKVLRVVGEMHGDLPDFVRGGDHITLAVSEMALEMLVASDLRPEAKYFVGKAERIVTEAENEPNQRRSLRRDVHDSFNPHIRKPPPELPPLTSYPITSHFKPERPIYDALGNHLIQRSTHSANRIDSSREDQYYDPISDSGTNPFEEHGDQALSHDQESDCSQNRTFSNLYQSTPTTHQEKIRNSTQSLHHDFVDSRLGNNSRTTNRGSPRQTNHNFRESQRIQLNTPLTPSPRNRNPKFTEVTYPDPKHSLESMSATSLAECDRPFSSRRSVISPNVLPAKPRRQSSHLKTLSVSGGLHWKTLRKQGVRNAFLPYADLLGQLNKRDHLFLIDDFTSMKDHWSEVNDVFELLAYMVKETDPDGIELYFTNSDGKKKSKTTTELVQIVCDKFPNGNSNVKNRLDLILQGHLAKLHEYQAKLRRRKSFIPWSKMLGLPTAPLPLNIYILTDGVWQGQCDPSPMIRSTAQYLDENLYFKQQVGIQFIRFGDDPRGKRRLEFLDSGLNLPMDIVDTEDSNGNVWKMLLGGTDPQWDDDDDDGNRSHSTNVG